MTGSVVSPALRQRVRDLATPIARGLGRLGLTPNALTLIGFLGTCAAAFAAAMQAWLVAGVLVLVFGIFDLFDGTLARASGKVTRFGAYLDSTLDRAGEAIVYVAIIIAGSGLGGTSSLAVLGSIAMGSAFLVSYTRSKSEGLGFTTGTGMAAVGVMPREVRVVILSLGLILTGIEGTANPLLRLQTINVAGIEFALPWAGERWLAMALMIIGIGAIITTIQRILHVRAQSREG